MRWPFLLAWLLGIAVSGLSTEGLAAPAKPPIALESITGCYTRVSDTLFDSLVLRLNPDFSYSAVIHGDIGDWGTASGDWRLSANVVILTPDKETFRMIGLLSRLSVRRIKGQYSMRPMDTEEWGELSSSPCVPSDWEHLWNSVFKKVRLVDPLRDTRAAAERGDALAMSKLAEMYAFGRGGVEHDDNEAVKWYRKAAEQGLAEAAYRIGVIYRDGNGVARDYAQAVQWFRKAAEQGDANAQSDLGVMYRDGRGVAEDDGQALLWFRKAAEQGDIYGQNNLAGMYVCGCGVGKDDAQALEWFNKAGEQVRGFGGDLYHSRWDIRRLRERDKLRRWKKAANRGGARAKTHLGELYERGNREYGDDGREKDAAAVLWYRRAAEQDDAAGQDNLGVMYRDGRGVARDDEQAVGWFRKSAEQGDAGGENHLGVMLRDGRGVVRDDVEAVQWFRKSAEQGYAVAQNNLGAMYRDGLGEPQDQAQAVMWFRKASQDRLGRLAKREQSAKENLPQFRKAADEGDAFAQVVLGWSYERGLGVAKSDAQAVSWYRKAAELGYSEGQNSLALMYRDGRGVAKDDAQAALWSRKATEQGEIAQSASGSGTELMLRYQKAADQGDEVAQANLGMMYRDGLGVSQDDAEAVRWFRKAIGRGWSPSQISLALMYRDGRGVARDDEQAVALLRKVAKGDYGSQSAQFYLGEMYAAGHGVARDDVEAVAWFRKAGEENPRALYRLGEMYAAGRGVAKDDKVAVMLFQKAAKKENETNWIGNDRDWALDSIRARNAQQREGKDANPGDVPGDKAQ